MPHRCGNSHAMWDHTVLPATRMSFLINAPFHGIVSLT